MFRIHLLRNVSLIVFQLFVAIISSSFIHWLCCYFTGIFGSVVALSYTILVYDNPGVHPRISYEEQRYLNKYITHNTNDEVSQRIIFTEILQLMEINNVLATESAMASHYNI